jgi:cytidylate kinase
LTATPPLIVAIDGPTGVGKSTVARLLARRLGVPYLDTGAMYRALGLKVLERRQDPRDSAAVERLLPETEISLEAGADGALEVLLDGVPVRDRIRTQEVGAAASAVALLPAVRRRMVALQQQSAERTGGVLEGRDIGTKVFPHTPYKFFLDARPEIRFRRRHQQLTAQGRTPSLAEVGRQVEERDRQDQQRQDSPLTCDASYRRLDASEKSAEAVVEEMLRAVAEIGASRP